MQMAKRDFKTCQIVYALAYKVSSSFCKSIQRLNLGMVEEVVTT